MNTKLFTLLVCAALVFGACSTENLAGDAGAEKAPVPAPLSKEYSLLFRQPLVDTLTSQQLLALANQKIGKSVFSQTLALGGSGLQNTGINYVENEDDIVQPFFVVDTNAPFFRWSGQFTPGLTGTVKANSISTWVGTPISILGSQFTIEQASFINNILSIGLREKSTNRLYELQSSGIVEVDNDPVSDAKVVLSFTRTPSKAGDVIVLNNIIYELTADATDGTTVYAESSVKSNLKRPQGMLGSWDLVTKKEEFASNSIISIKPKSDTQFVLGISTASSSYELPLIALRGTTLTWGDDDDDLVFREFGQNVKRDAYFILATTADAKVLRYTDYDENQRVLEFEDVVSGNSISVAIATNGTGSLVVGGRAYYVLVSNVSAQEPALTLDLNGDGRITRTTVPFVLGQTQLRFENAVTLTYAQYKSGSEYERWPVHFTVNYGELRAGILASEYVGPRKGIEEWNEFNLYESEGYNESTAITDYGTKVRVDEGFDPVEISFAISESEARKAVILSMG